MSAPVVAVRPWRSYAIVSVAYLLALAAGAATLTLAPRDWAPFAALALADVVATLVVFGVSFAVNNTSVYDPYWSVAPIALAGWLALGPGAARGLDARQALVLGLVTAWGLRLTYNWLMGWTGLAHEDWRYVEFRQKTPKAYWLVSLTGLHLFPTLIVLLGALPLWPALVTGGGPLGPLDALAAVVTVAAVLIEAVADEQLRAFRRAKATDGAICDVGLWRYSRHPNYFGEVLFWVGLWLFGVAAGGAWWIALGWLSMVALFVGASIPMAERRSLARRPAYAAHQRQVSMLVPLPRRGEPASAAPPA